MNLYIITEIVLSMIIDLSVCVLPNIINEKRWGRTCLFLILGHRFPLHPMKDGDSPLVLLCRSSYHLAGSCFTPKWQINGEKSNILQEEDLWEMLIFSPLAFLSAFLSEGCNCRHFLGILYHRSLLLPSHNPAHCGSYCPEGVPSVQVLSLQTPFFVLYKIQVSGVYHVKPLEVEPD